MRKKNEKEVKTKIPNKHTDSKELTKRMESSLPPLEEEVKTPVEEWIAINKGQFVRYMNYTMTSNWLENYTEEEYALQNSIAGVAADRLKYFIAKFEMYIDYDFAQEFIRILEKPIMLFIERCDTYIESNDWTTLEDPRKKLDEMTKQTEIMKDLNSIRDKYKELNLNRESDSELPIHSDKPIPFMMKDVIKQKYPHIVNIENRVKSLSLSKPSLDIYDVVNSSTEMFINIKNPPPYDITKHYFEQPQSTIDFYEEELRKINAGVTINGVHIHPWLYWHMNHFKTDIPMDVLKGTKHYDPHKKVAIINPPLRDNEWFLADLYRQADEQNRGIFVFSSRRLGKTVFEASILSWISTKAQSSESLVTGGSEGDLAKLSKSIEIAFTNMTPAFYLPRNNNDWNRYIQFGLKDKAGIRIPYSDIFIKNVNGGRGSSTEKTAGNSVDGWVCDEAGKFNVKPIYQASIPSFETPSGWRVVPILTATGGNNELSASARSMLMFPEENKLLLMDWDLIESYIPEEKLITWERRPYGIFMPAQMSFKTGIHKDESNLATFLKKETDKKLQEIQINTTNWGRALDVINKDREALSRDKDSLNKEKMYYPIDPLECFLSSISNPFCTKEAQEHKENLIASGDYGKYVDIGWDYNKNRLKWGFSEKEPATFPFSGGVMDAPIIMFEEPPEDPEVDYVCVAGLDHYKQDKSNNSPSLGALYIFKRNLNIDEYSNKIVCSYVARPDQMEIFNNTVEMLLKGYGAICLQEGADISFQQHLRAKNLESYYLANGEEVAKANIKPNAQQSNKFGLSPTATNQEYLFKLVQSYVNEEIEVGKNEDGLPIKIRGVTRIKDLTLLDEIIDYTPGANVDRIIAFGHALALGRYYDSINLLPKPRKQTNDEIDPDTWRKKMELRNKAFNPYGGSRFSPYSRRF